MEPAALKERLSALPTRPGVYIFRDEGAVVLYVGKAVNLRSRMRSYFQQRLDSIKVRRMVAQIADFEFIVTDSELEALVLECNLIKKYRPKYNVRLRDDKQYPYLRVSLDEEWPRIHVTRRYRQDGARYFGPFTDSRSVWRTLDLLNKLFPYRSCHKPITGRDARPCLEYHIHRCLGPCIGAASHDDYVAAVRQACLFLEGKQEEILRQLRQAMEEASEALQFERAAYLRDQIQAVEKVIERQKIVSTATTDQDVIAFARDDGQACVQVFFIRAGKLVGREHFLLEGTQDEEARKIMTSFVTQFYDSAAYVPPRILLQSEVDEAEVIQDWLRSKRGYKVSIQVPRRGQRKELVDMVAANASEALAQMRAQWLADEKKTGAALTELGERLGLPGPPNRVECYDISDIRGTAAVGSMVVFEHGQAKPSHYRRFRIKAVVEANDYAMLQEVLRRRFKRGISSPEAGHPAWAILPDLVMVDGGKGQLSAALEAMEEAGVVGIPVVALAKEREEIFLPDSSEPILLPRTSPSLYLAQRVRDEAHRFAHEYHQKVRHQGAFGSALDDIPGIGAKRRAALLKQFGSLKAIREATVEEIAALPGMNKSIAQRVKEHL